MRISCLVILLCCFFTSAFAIGVEPKNIKRWDSGKLTWDDFKESTDEKGVTSSLRAWIGGEKTKDKQGSITVYHPVLYTYIDLDRAWTHPDYRTEEALRYNQAVFDLMEYYCRKLQQDIDKGLPTIEIEAAMRNYSATYDEQIKSMREETVEGRNEKKLVEWETYIAGLLDSTSPSVPVNFVPRNFGYGIVLGANIEFPTGKLAHYFTPSGQFSFGVDLAYKKTHFLADFAGGFTRNGADMLIPYKNELIKWEKNRHTIYSTIDLCLGYEVYDSHRVRVMPFAGIVWSQYSKVMDVDDHRNEIKVAVSDFNAIAGLTVDYKFSTLLSVNPSSWFGHKEMYTSSLRMKAYVSYADYDLFERGCHVGISVAYSGFARMVRFR